MPINQKTFWNLTLKVTFVASILLQVLVLLAVYKKGGGTTGGEPYQIIIPFAFTLFLALYVHFQKREKTNYLLISVIIISSVFGCFLPYWLESTGSLRQYDRWLRYNQSLTEENLGLCLFIFALAEFITITLFVFWKKRIFRIRKTEYK